MENVNLSWDKETQMWHIMKPLYYDMTVASCEKKKQAGRRFVDWNNMKFIPAFRFPHGRLTPSLIDNFKFKKICPKCIKKEIKDIEEFKCWLIVQKLKYL